jgi:hypothetical protein
MIHLETFARLIFYENIKNLIQMQQHITPIRPPAVNR